MKCLMASGASTMLNRTKTLVNGSNYGWDNGTQFTFHHDIADVNDNGLHP